MRRKAGVAESNDPDTRARMTPRRQKTEKLGKHSRIGHPPPFES